MAEIVDPHNLRITLTGGGIEQVEFGHAILATGSRPARASLARQSARVGSTRALDPPSIPKTPLVVGGRIGLSWQRLRHAWQRGDDR